MNMKNKKKITIIYLIAMMLSTFILSGCALTESVNLNDEQEALVTEYAAGLLVKYTKGHEMGLRRVNELDFEELNVAPTPTPAPLPEELVEEVEDEALVQEVAGDGSGESEPYEIAIMPMNEAFGLYGASLTYDHYDLCKTYPEATDDELVFSMNATPGNDLLIEHFMLYNGTGSELNCTTNLNGNKIRALINGSEKVRCELTFLMNDLANYSKSMENNFYDDVVLVFEVPEGTQINTLDLLLVGSQGESMYNLYNGSSGNSVLMDEAVAEAIDETTDVSDTSGEIFEEDDIEKIDSDAIENATYEINEE